MDHDGTPLPAEGDILAGKYRVERILGAGGMGLVLAARHVHLNDRVALKFLHPQVARSPSVVARFLREAQSAARIKSEHVARVYDVGTMESGVPYMVMEHLIGHDLAAILEQRGPLPIADAIDYVLQACEAIAEAHALGLVHRDLKPANLFLTQRADGSSLVKVLDFGISKSVAAIEPGAVSQDLTTTQGVMGSPLYMSPEQVRSAKHVDARADVWSLGVILYELIAGKPPFEAETASALLASIVADPPASLVAARPDVPAELCAIVGACLEKDPAQRVPDVAALAAALAPFADARSRVSIDRVKKTLGHRTTISSAPPPIALSSGADRTSQRPNAGSGGDRAADAPAAASRAALPAVAHTTAEWARTSDGTKRSRRVFATIGLVAFVVAALAILSLRRDDARAKVAGPSPPSAAPYLDSAALAPAPEAPAESAAGAGLGAAARESTEPSAASSNPAERVRSAAPSSGVDRAAHGPDAPAGVDRAARRPAPPRRDAVHAAPTKTPPRDDLGGLIDDRH